MEFEPIWMVQTSSVEKVIDKHHLQQFLRDIESKGGEGVVVRDPKVLYIDKRSSKALKVKTFLDKECKIVAYNEGRGRYQGVLGSLTC